MSNKAISQVYKCNPAKMPLDRNPYVQMDIDRFIGHLYDEAEKLKKLLVDPEAVAIHESERIRFSIEDQIDAYEGLIGMIEANSFK